MTMSLKRIYKVFIAVILMGFAFGAGTITGTVSDQDGNPLAFANVVITYEIVNGEEVALKP